MKQNSLTLALPFAIVLFAVGIGCGGGGSSTGTTSGTTNTGGTSTTGTTTTTGSTGSTGVSPFAGTYNGSEEYVQGTFANPLGIVNIGPTTLTITTGGNIQGQTKDAISGKTYTYTGTVQALTATTGTAQLNGLPGPFNSPTFSDLQIGGNIKTNGLNVILDLGSSLGEVHMSLEGGTISSNAFAGNYTGTASGSGVGSGTVTALSVSPAGVVSGTVTIGGVVTTISGTLTAQDVTTITLTNSSGTTQLTGAAAFTQSSGLTIFLSNTSGTETVTLSLTASN